MPSHGELSNLFTSYHQEKEPAWDPRPRDCCHSHVPLSPQMLARLLKSSHPEDLRAANKLIKEMVQEVMAKARVQGGGGMGCGAEPLREVVCTCAQWPN